MKRRRFPMSDDEMYSAYGLKGGIVGTEFSDDIFPFRCTHGVYDIEDMAPVPYADEISQELYESGANTINGDMMFDRHGFADPEISLEDLELPAPPPKKKLTLPPQEPTSKSNNSSQPKKKKEPDTIPSPPQANSNQEAQPMIDYSTLNEAQQEAVTTTEGYVRVIASAGSGKTRALAYRFAFLVDEIGVSPESIACVTFTNKAGTEMKERIRGMLGDFNSSYICTFHSLSVKVLHEDIRLIGWPVNFRIMDDDDMNTLLRRVSKKLGCKRDPNLMALKEQITRLKANPQNGYGYVTSLMGEPLLITKSASEYVLDEEIIAAYLNEQKRAACLDFNDLICIPLYLFANHPDIQQKWAERFQYVMVDEFQDVSGENYRFCEAISSFHHNLFVVGDPDQLIYSWRGAQMKYLMQFENLHPGAKNIMMSTNYRCSGEIIGVANRLVEHNQNRIKKTMIPHRPSMEKVQYLHTADPVNAGQFVASEIARLHGQGIKYEDIAILYRAHFVSGTYEQQLIKAGIPYLVCSGTPFYQRKEIKDALSYLGLINHENSMDFERALMAPNRGISSDQVDAVITYAETANISLMEALEKKHGKSNPIAKFIAMIRKYQGEANSLTVSELMDGILIESGLDSEYRSKPEDERLDNINALKSSILDMEKAVRGKLGLQEYLDEVGTFTGADTKNTKKSVSLMTVHGAKGLEFPYVFTVGMNEGVFPTYRADNASAMEEERRLAYVAYTRAKDKLYIVEAANSGYQGRFAYPSRFIFDADLSTLSVLKQLGAELIQSAKGYFAQAEARIRAMRDENVSEGNAWKAGASVRHAIFGNGTIVSIQNDMVTVRFANNALRTIRKDKLALS